MKKAYLVLILVLFAPHIMIGKGISPYDYGLKEARTGSERASVLYRTHMAAIDAGVSVDYSGIRSIDLEITRSFKSIPLDNGCDFQGVVFNVVNNYKNDIELFSFSQKSKDISVSATSIDKGTFIDYPELSKGYCLLIISDGNLWVDNRVGYSYGHIRRDVLLVKNGKSMNSVIAPYNNPESSPQCSYCSVSSIQKIMENLTINRTVGSKYRTTCIKLQNQNNVLIKRVTINTPKSDLSGDSAIKVQNCTNVTFEDVVINGTYSQKDKYGYGFSINNAWNTVFLRVNGNGEWGILGNNNMSDTILRNCQVNRFDIHCYGRNAYLADCVFDGGERGWYCGGSSIFGTIQYDRCTFTNCTPIAYGDSYKTAVGADIIFNDCVFNVTKNKASVFSTSVLNKNLNPRKGLSQKNLPNIQINGMVINVPKGVDKVSLYGFGKGVSYTDEIGYLSKVSLNNVRIVCERSDKPVTFSLFSVPVKTVETPHVEIKGLYAPNTVVDLSVSSNKRGRVRLKESNMQKLESSEKIKLKVRKCKIAQ